MPKYRPSELRGVRPKKALSQNFLIDRNILEKISHAADVQEGDTVFEIGPGPGALSEELLKKGARVIAVEKDAALVKGLQEMSSERFTVYEGDALTFPLPEMPKDTKLVANLPYKITTPLLERFLPLHTQFQSLIIMVQKEVGERMTARPKTPQYGSLSLFVQAYGEATYAFTVKPGSFYPPPSVHSCVVHIALRPFPFPFSPVDFLKLTRRAFGQRRKMLRSSLKGFYPTQRLGEWATKRPEELSLEEFATLFTALQEEESST